MGRKNSNLESEDCHIVALKDGVEIEIDQAPSGKGYTCIGCGKEMQSVRFKDRNHRSYFRHHHDGVDTNNKCTWSDETYRHGLAKQILTQIKMIKVPSVKKYPVTGDGPAMIIRKKRIITADHVEPELYFFEDKNGDIRFQKHIPNSAECDNIIKPDVVFFDKEMQPILFIELVATHKITPDKKVKIKRIGVDTVQVNVAKDSRKSIEKSFYKTKRTKWVFNNEYEDTPYRSPAGEIEGPVLPVDAVQQRLYEETLSCRIAEIGSIMRSINRYLQSDPYRETEQGIRDEIARLNAAIITASIQLRDRDARLNSEARDTLKPAIEGNSIEERELDTAFEELRRSEITYNGEERILENREHELHKVYREKEDGIRQQETKFTRELEQEERKLTERHKYARNFRGDGRERAKAKRARMELDFDKQNKKFDESISSEERTIREIEQQLENLSGRVGEEERVSNEILERTEENERRAIAKFQQGIEQLPGEYEELRNRASKESGDLESELRGRFQQRQEDLLEAMQGGDYQRASAHSTGISALLQFRRHVLDLNEKQSALQRLRRAYESFNKKSYQNWPEFKRVSENHG